MAPQNNNEPKSFSNNKEPVSSTTDILCSPTTPISFNNNISHANSSNVIANLNNSSFASEEPATQSTVFTTTALIETREVTEETAPCSSFENDDEDDNSSTCSNEILL